MILLFSGGLDSYIAWHYLEKPQTIYVDIGHRYAKFEHDQVIRLVPDTIIEDRLFLGDWEEPDANIPYRNAFLVLIAAKHAVKDTAPVVVLVVQKGEMDIPDRTHRFMTQMSFMFDFKVYSPFTEMTKTNMVKWYCDNVHDPRYEKLLSTRSCYAETEKPCGQCTACFRRWVALTNNDIVEEYENPILEYDKIPVYLEKMLAGGYDEQRRMETFRALMKHGYKL